MVAERLACLARNDGFERLALRVIPTLVDDDLALAVSLRDLTGKFANQCPVQVCKWRVVEMSFHDGADIGEITIAMCRGLIELAAATYRTIAVVIGMTLEFPLVGHCVPPLRTGVENSTSEYRGSLSVGL